jgi:hypothetical protein
VNKVTVYHPHHPEINQGYTDFSGEEIEVTAGDDGSLVIAKWQTNTEQGSAIFAKGGWTYVCISALRILDTGEPAAGPPPGAS